MFFERIFRSPKKTIVCLGNAFFHLPCMAKWGGGGGGYVRPAKVKWSARRMGCEQGSIECDGKDCRFELESGRDALRK